MSYLSKKLELKTKPRKASMSVVAMWNMRLTRSSGSLPHGPPSERHEVSFMRMCIQPLFFAS